MFFEPLSFSKMLFTTNEQHVFFPVRDLLYPWQFRRIEIVIYDIDWLFD